MKTFEQNCFEISKSQNIGMWESLGLLQHVREVKSTQERFICVLRAVCGVSFGVNNKTALKTKLQERGKIAISAGKFQRLGEKNFLSKHQRSFLTRNIVVHPQVQSVKALQLLDKVQW